MAPEHGTVESEVLLESDANIEHPQSKETWFFGPEKCFSQARQTLGGYTTMCTKASTVNTLVRSGNIEDDSASDGCVVSRKATTRRFFISFGVCCATAFLLVALRTLVPQQDLSTIPKHHSFKSRHIKGSGVKQTTTSTIATTPPSTLETMTSTPDAMTSHHVAPNNSTIVRTLPAVSLCGNRQKGSEFSIAVDMKPEMAWGISMTLDAHHLRVDSVLHEGLIPSWNKEHSNKKVLPGCCIVKVNGVVGASRNLLDELGNANGLLRLTIWRWEDKSAAAATEVGPGIVTVAGKRSNKTLPLTSTTPTPIKTDASKAKMQRSARISWAAHPAKCLDLRAGGISNGNVLQLWDCRNGSKDMLFLIPDDGSVGKIKLKSNPEFCMDASGRMGTTLMIWHCEQAKIEHMLFKMPNRSRGLIRLARSPTKCIDVPGGKADNGHRLQLWWCEDRHLDHMTFNIIDSP